MGQVVYLGFCLLGCLILGSSSTPVQVTNSSDVAPRYPCPPGVFSFRYICYAYFDRPVDWYTAEFACQNLRPGSHLVSFSNSVEEKMVSTYIRSRNPLTDNVWTGLSAGRDYNRLNWQWSDRSPYNSGSALWDNRSPGTYISSSECLLLTNIRNPSHLIRWTQQNCDVAYPYVCKYRAWN